MPLTWKQRAPYVLEVQALIATLLKRLDEIRDVATRWNNNVESADLQLVDESSIDLGAFTKTMKAQVTNQNSFFDLLEAFLASWARLSLLLFPVGGQGPDADFRSERGQALRQALGVTDDSAFADREFRDAWMHFDERLDSAIAGGTFGNRQRFVKAEQAKDHVNTTLRLMELDTLVLHYRSRDGSVRSVDLNQMRDSLSQLAATAETALHA